MNGIKLSLAVLVLSLITQSGFSQSKVFDPDYASHSYVCDGRIVLEGGSLNWECVAFKCAWDRTNPLGLSNEQRNTLTKSLYETQLVHRAITDPDLIFAKRFMKADAAVQVMQSSLTEMQIERLNTWVPGFIVSRMGDEQKSKLVFELISKSLPKDDKKKFVKSLKKKLFDVVRKLRAKKWEELVESSPSVVKDDFKERKVESKYRLSLYQQMDFELGESKVDLSGEVKSACLENAKTMDVELVKKIKEATEKGWKSAMTSLPSNVESRFILPKGKAK